MESTDFRMGENAVINTDNDEKTLSRIARRARTQIGAERRNALLRRDTEAALLHRPDYSRFPIS